MQQTYIGVDISKARLDVFIPGQGFFSVCNDAAGIAELVARGRPLTAWFIFESCGSYERMLVGPCGRGHSLHPSEPTAGA